MHEIDGSIYTHLHYKNGGSGYTTRKVSEDAGIIVKDHFDLLKIISHIPFYNPKLDLVFRGQVKDRYTRSTIRYNGRSSIYPRIFRPPKNESRLKSHLLAERFGRLDSLVKIVGERYDFSGKQRVKAHVEVAWALLQHYEICDTPLIDVTDSIEVALFFATFGNNNEYGYFYIFGLPRHHSSISYQIDDRLVSVKLSAASPPEAIRAHFQRALFVGDFPHSNKRESGHNLSKRMLAKLRIDMRSVSQEKFFTLPEDLIYPKEDELKPWLDKILQS